MGQKPSKGVLISVSLLILMSIGGLLSYTVNLETLPRALCGIYHFSYLALLLFSAVSVFILRNWIRAAILILVSFFAVSSIATLPYTYHKIKVRAEQVSSELAGKYNDVDKSPLKEVISTAQEEGLIDNKKMAILIAESREKRQKQIKNIALSWSLKMTLLTSIFFVLINVFIIFFLTRLPVKEQFTVNSSSKKNK
ncbi:MAG: hypothetical protein ABH883_00365 [Candidatus Omnitrophota bacterium]